MSQLCVARQPIFDDRLRVVGYELLFRAAQDAPRADVVEAGAATASVLLNAFAELGLDAVVPGGDAWINVPAELLVTDPPLPAPPSRIVVELLEDADPTPDVVGALWRAKRRGYRVALDDFVYAPQLESLVRAADIVKVDVRAHDGAALEAQVSALRAHGVPLLAEKIETHAEFERCRELGFAYFQGFFLSRPRTLTARSLPARSAGPIAMLAELQDAEAEPDRLAAAIGRDVGLSYKLLRYINSAFFSLPRTVSSIRDAITLLGTGPVRRWGSLMALSGIDDQPHELLVTAAVRARTCELLASAVGDGRGDAYYTTGLFSVVDAMMDVPLRTVVDALPLADEVREGLLDHRGGPGTALAAIKDYERGDLAAVPDALRTAIGPAYLDALEHADGVAAVIA